MPKVMINQYKRQDVFRCSQTAHFRFEKNVSVYHVLKEKKCSPEGCIYFLWKCRLLNKGNSCPKKYQHVGRDCFSCKNYFDEKIVHQPEITLDEEAYRKFQIDLEEFEDWLEQNVGKWVEFSGIINSAKPHFKKVRFGSKETLSFPGFLISFREGYIDRTFFDDNIYLTVSRRTQQNLKFARGDEVDFQARLRTDRGRMVLERVRYVEFPHKEKEESWTQSQALVAKSTGTEIECQPEKCAMCENGCLLDVIEKTEKSSPIKRHLFCLAEVQNPEECYHHAVKRLKKEEELKYSTESENP